MLYDGYAIPPFYDSLLGKLIVHGPDRPSALARLRRAIDELEIGGMKTTKPLYAILADDPDVINGHYHTQFLEGWLTKNPLAGKQ
jgi:acetyl-CoA carboxylase biotin carboxylase subunit